MKALVEGKLIRFAPSRNGEPASSIWRIWAKGSDVYALSRMFGGALKISVHETGQIHLRQAAKQKQDLAPLMPLGSGPWLCAFELRFLLSNGARMPSRERESLKNKTPQLISVPEGYALFANLIIGPREATLDLPLPVEFSPPGETLWRTQLRNGRIAALVGRMLALDEENRGHIRYLREDLKVTYNAATKSERQYVEVHKIRWSAGGNVVLIVPLGDEAIRSEQELAQSDTLPAPTRTFRYRNVRSTVELTAPNQKNIAVIAIPEVDKQIELRKGESKTVELGLLTMKVDRDNLTPGCKFTVSPKTFSCNPIIDGASFPRWQNEIHASFDGYRLITAVSQASGALQNKNLATPIDQLGDGEEILVVIPSGAIKVSATLDVPSTSTEFLGRFTWRDRR